MSSAAVILLAAGNSSRMGEPKQLLEFRGRPLLRHAAEVALSSGCQPVIVVLGDREQEMRTILDNVPVYFVVNDRWREGMGTSIQAGLRAIGKYDVAGAILALADQPFVSPSHLRALAAHYEQSGAPVIASSYCGTVGVPAFFARDAFPLLQALKPAQGCKGIILNHKDTVLIECPEAGMDVDTPEDYQRAIAAQS